MVDISKTYFLIKAFI